MGSGVEWEAGDVVAGVVMIHAYHGSYRCGGCGRMMFTLLRGRDVEEAMKVRGPVRGKVRCLTQGCRHFGNFYDVEIVPVLVRDVG